MPKAIERLLQLIVRVGAGSTRLALPAAVTALPSHVAWASSVDPLMRRSRLSRECPKDHARHRLSDPVGVRNRIGRDLSRSVPARSRRARSPPLPAEGDRRVPLPGVHRLARRGPRRRGLRVRQGDGRRRRT